MSTYEAGTTFTFDSMGRRRAHIPVAVRILRKVEETPAGCWQWSGHINASGYGQVADIDRRMKLAHRVAYREFVGPIPDGLTIDHLCRNRACVNPAHLEPVTQRENTMRGNTITAHQAAQTHCKRGHEFTPENTYSKKNGGRDCRTCAVARSRARRADA